MNLPSHDVADEYIFSLSIVGKLCAGETGTCTSHPVLIVKRMYYLNITGSLIFLKYGDKISRVNKNVK